MEEKNKSLLKIHLSVLLFGLSGLFGKLISLSSTVIVFGRVFFSSIFLFIILIYFKKKYTVKTEERLFLYNTYGYDSSNSLDYSFLRPFKSLQ